MNSGNLTLSLIFLWSNFSIPSCDDTAPQFLNLLEDFVHAVFFLRILNDTITMTFLLLILLGKGCLKNQSGLSLTSPIVYTVFFPNFHKFCLYLRRSVIFVENTPLTTFITDEVSYILLCANSSIAYRKYMTVSVHTMYTELESSFLLMYKQTYFWSVFITNFHVLVISILQTYNQRANVSLLCYWCCAFFDHCDKYHIRIPVVSVSTPFCKSHIVSGYLYNLIIT